ncbi:MAG: hypothetical protein LBK08_13585 [Treponema sp.]|jgi:hypothetical protein|nr:hypothetical protein [Treponema sp.]
MTRLLQSAVRNFGAEAVSAATLSGGMAVMSCDKELKMAKKSPLFVKEQDKSTKKSALPQLSRSAKAKITAGVMGVAALFGAGGCSDDASPTPMPQVCICPNGTFHNPGTSMPCCGGFNCDCKVAYNVSLGGKQIRVEDTTGLANKADIEGALEWINDNLSIDTNLIYFKQLNTSPVMVIENTHNVRVDGSKFFIGMDAINININDAIFEAIVYIYNSGDSKMTKLPDKEIIRLANGRTLNVGAIAKLGRQFDSSRETVRLSFAAGRQGRQA